jgi:hypothetical protein
MDSINHPVSPTEQRVCAVLSNELNNPCPVCKSWRTYDLGHTNQCYNCGHQFNVPKAEPVTYGCQQQLVLTVPPTFFWDTDDCDCLVDFDSDTDMLKYGKRTLTVRLTDTDAHELLDRADFYASSVGDMDCFGLCMSARATAKAIRKQWAGAAKPRF